MRFIPNIITSIRIVGSFIMMFTPTLSNGFYFVYTISGISDVLDGFIARKTNTTSEFGRKLDSVADLLFFTTMMIKIMPYLLELLPTTTWMIINIALVIRIILYVYFGLIKHKFLSNHTITNKLTGLMMFFVPYLLKTKIFGIYAFITSSIALLSAIYEIILINKKVNN